MSYEKLSDKKYTIRIDGELRDINVPYGKARALFGVFVGEGGVIDEHGEVKTDLRTLVDQFGKVGDCLLSEYGSKGQVLVEGDCSQLSVAETFDLFNMATEIVESFTSAISQNQNPKAGLVAEAKEPKAKKTKE